MKETQVINDVLNGNTEAYAELIGRYHIGLIIHCERLIGDREEAEDIAQEAFVKAYTNLKKFNPEYSFSTWLYKIATNAALDYMRKHKKQIQVEDIEQLTQVTENNFLEKEQHQAVRDAVKKLKPPEYKYVIEAYYWRGLSYQEIAQELNKPINTIGTYILRAKTKLKGELSWLQ